MLINVEMQKLGKIARRVVALSRKHGVEDDGVRLCREVSLMLDDYTMPSSLAALCTIEEYHAISIAQAACEAAEL